MGGIFYYEPEDYFDVGGLGEAKATFKTNIEIEYEDGQQKYKVDIQQVLLDLELVDRVVRIDVTAKVLKSDYAKEAWAADVWRAYKKTTS